ncbi:MAG: hypothetical protein IT434_03335 [Phycisphaerales bacterium]|jgi:flagellar basal-body rod protein FlgB|nr:hypothetical protein [Phycisphaerales bacterium]
MFIGDILNSGAMPALEAGVQFAAQRQRLLAHNIANISTPDFRPVDLSIKDFRATLADAIDRRREATGGEQGRLDLRKTSEIEMIAGGTLRFTPKTPSGNVLFHDRNNRDVERLMADQAETVAAYRAASDLLRSRFALLKSAISQRV